jgi:hypothetical protein
MIILMMMMMMMMMMMNTLVDGMECHDCCCWGSSSLVDTSHHHHHNKSITMMMITPDTTRYHVMTAWTMITDTSIIIRVGMVVVVLIQRPRHPQGTSRIFVVVTIIMDWEQVVLL